jgi:hypothetical protein
MPYVLKDDQGAIKGPESFESFCLYYDFAVNMQGLVTINEMFWAVYFSGYSQNLNFKNPDRGATSYTIEDLAQGAGSFEIKHSQLENSRLSQFASEFSQLHLFECINTNTGRPTNWFVDGNWNPNFQVPEHNVRANIPFIKHTLSLTGGARDRYAYWVTSKENAGGTQSMAIAMPYLANSVFGRILAAHGGIAQTITIKTTMDGGQGSEWGYFGNTPLPTGAVKGFCFIAQGAFKNLSLSSALDDWVGLRAVEAIAARLSEVVSGALLYPRTLSTAHDTANNSVVVADGQPPVELLFLRDLNQNAPVPRVFGGRV